MPMKILVAVDGSDSSNKALEFAANLSAKMGAELTILHVLMHGKPAQEFERMAEVEHIVTHEVRHLVPDSLNFPPQMAELMEHKETEKARAVAELGDYVLTVSKRRAADLGAAKAKTLIRDGDYADAILDAAEDTGTDLVVMGRRGLGRARRLVLGSVSNKVLQNAECSVAMIQ